VKHPVSWNRRAFDDHYAVLAADALATPPSIMMIDIDEFKLINDRHGHHAGDRALIGVAHSLTRSLRPTDFAARYGGDEFVVLLPDTPLAPAAEIAERIRAAVEHDMADLGLTVSVGVFMTQNADRRRAALGVDGALYQAKERGRNQVALA